jgi:hypothetical protein
MTVAADTRERRDFAREVKFLARREQVDALRAWAREHLTADAHGGGPFGDAYETTSLYFETPEFDVYHRKGSYARSKFRVRRYGQANVAFLERKFRTDRLLAKRRTMVSAGDLERLAGVPDPSWPGYWFHRRIVLRRLRPLVQMSYERTARVGEAPTGPVRMTIDTNLRVLPMPDRGFLPGTGFPLIENQVIVEVKYRVEPPALVRRFAETFQLAPQPVSKYRLGLGALDYVPKES